MFKLSLGGGIGTLDSLAGGSLYGAPGYSGLELKLLRSLE